MLRWCGTDFAGEPTRDVPTGAVAMMGGEALIEVELVVGGEPEDDENDPCP